MADPISVSAAEYERLKKADELLKEILPIEPRVKDDWHCFVVTIDCHREPKAKIYGRIEVLAAAIATAAAHDYLVSEIVSRLIRIFVPEDEDA